RSPMLDLLDAAKAFLRQVADKWAPKGPRLGEPFERVFEAEVYALLSDSEFRQALKSTGTSADTDERIFLVVGTLLNRIFTRYVENLRSADQTSIIALIKEAVALVTSNLFVALPYLMAFLAQSSDSLVARDVRRAFGLPQKEKVVLV